MVVMFVMALAPLKSAVAAMTIVLAGRVVGLPIMNGPVPWACGRISSPIGIVSRQTHGAGTIVVAQEPATARNGAVEFNRAAVGWEEQCPA